MPLSSLPIDGRQHPRSDPSSHRSSVTMDQESAAQPDLVALSNAFATLAEELPLFNNLFLGNVQQQLDQLNIQMAAMTQRITQMDQHFPQTTQQMTQHMDPYFTQMTQRMDQQFAQVDQKLGQHGLMGRMDTIVNKMDLLPMRYANALASHDPDQVLIGPAGLIPGPINTKNALLGATVAELDALQVIVQAPNYAGNLDEKRAILKGFLGVM